MRIWAGVVAVLGLSVAAQSGTVRVPADYSTIQGALDVSSVGDTVLVAPGTYSDYTVFGIGTAAVAIVPDGVVLRSEQGPTATTIDISPLEGAATGCVAFNCGDHTSGQTVIEGFCIVGFPPSSTGGSIGYCARVEVRDCVFEAAEPPDPGVRRKGLSTLLSDVSVNGCFFVRCASGTGAGIGQVGGALTVEGCTFLECANQGIRAIQGTGAATNSLTVRDCLFQRVGADLGGAGVSTKDLVNGVVVDGCRFEDITSNASGTVSMSGSGSKRVRNCVFHDIDLPTGSGGCVSAISGGAFITGNTMTYLHQVYGTGAAVYVFGAVLTVFENNIVAHTSGTTAVDVQNGGAVTAGCNVFWDNADGIGYTLDPTDRIVDPLFCDEELRDLTLHESSPCLPKNSLGCDLIGALGQGCGAVSVEAQSWGRTKSAYRSEESEAP